MRRPPLRYHGGKWRLAPWILEHFPPHKTYVEPYGGGASVLLRKSRAYAEVYNDLSGDVVNFFRALRDRGGELARAVELTPFSREEFYQAYVSSDDELESARRFAVRSHMGFGTAACTRAGRSGFRSNVTRTGNHPATNWRDMPRVLVEVQERLRGVVIENRHALDLLDIHDRADTLFYLDPPYVKSTRRPGSDDWDDAYAYEMSDEDHEALLSRVVGLDAMVVISGYSSELYDGVLKGWRRIERDAAASGNKGAVVRREVLWVNPAAARVTLFDGPLHFGGPSESP